MDSPIEPMPAPVQELRAALAVYRRAAEEWKARAEKAEAELARLRTFSGGRALNTPFDVPPDESLKPGGNDAG